MLILLINRFHCIICQIPTMSMRSRVFVLLAIVGNGQIYQWDLMSKFNIFAGLRQKVCVYIHVVVLERGLTSLYGKIRN